MHTGTTAAYRCLLMITGGYRWLLAVTTGQIQLQLITGGYQGLLVPPILILPLIRKPVNVRSSTDGVVDYPSFSSSSSSSVLTLAASCPPSLRL